MPEQDADRARRYPSEYPKAEKDSEVGKDEAAGCACKRGKR
jgi:hypothetical protein